MESSFLNPREAIEAAQPHEGMRVADFNAGAGFFTRAAARAVGEHGVVWAVDCHRGMLPRVKALAAAEGLHNVEVMYGTIERAGGSHLPGESFDLALAANLFFTLEDRPAAAREMRRILRRGGQALVVDWKDSFGGLGPRQDHLAAAEDIKRLFEEEGFTHVRDVPAGEYHWGFLMKKAGNK